MQLFFKLRFWIPDDVAVQQIGSIQVSLDDPDRYWELPFNIRARFDSGIHFSMSKWELQWIPNKINIVFFSAISDWTWTSAYWRNTASWYFPSMFTTALVEKLGFGFSYRMSPTTAQTMKADQRRSLLDFTPATMMTTIGTRGGKRWSNYHSLRGLPSSSIKKKTQAKGKIPMPFFYIKYDEIKKKQLRNWII